MDALRGSIQVPSTTLVREMPDGESVILDLETEKYFGLDEVGTAMWTALTSTPSVREAYDRLLEEFDVDGERLREDLAEFVAELAGRGLVRLSD